MMILKRSKKRSHRLNEYKIAKSQWRVRLGSKNQSRTGLTSPKPTRSLNCCCWKGWSSWSRIIKSHRKKSSRIWNTASGTTPRRMIQMNAKSSGSKFSWPSSKGSWSLKLLRGRWRSTSIPSLQIWWMWPETRMFLKPRSWRHHRPENLGLLIPRQW